ncbi:MAG TPA: hypothetical protein VFA20_30375 [Myxococcaceae bacterium]|nr:hypothetical protein [Myxococcaceae bacterium]
MPDVAPEAPVEAPEAPQAPAETEAPQTPAAPEAPKDDFAAPAGGTPDADRLAAARDPNDGMDKPAGDTDKSIWEKINAGQYPGVQPAFYQAPGIGVSAPREGTHIGMTEDAGMERGINRNFTNFAADRNAEVDHAEYSNDAAHSYNGAREPALDRARELGGRLDDATTRYQNATNDTERKAAAQDMATAYGQYLHMLQDNRAHGGTDRAEHYGNHVDDNPQSMAAARTDTRAAMTDLNTYLQSRGINPMQVNPGDRPSYHYPPVSGLADKWGAPKWDGVSRMWDRDAMARDLSSAFNSRLKSGNNAVGL